MDFLIVKLVMSCVTKTETTHATNCLMAFQIHRAETTSTVIPYIFLNVQKIIWFKCLKFSELCFIKVFISQAVCEFKYESIINLYAN